MKIILAADRNWAIGKDGDLLVSLPGDMKFFRTTTSGMTVVMGRATLESLPGKKALPKRRNIVMTTKTDYFPERCEIVHSIDELMELLGTEETDNVFVMGGARVYEELLPYCDTCWITKIDAEFPADRHFRDLDADEDFEITWESEPMEENGIGYRFVKYERKKQQRQ